MKARSPIDDDRPCALDPAKGQSGTKPKIAEFLRQGPARRTVDQLLQPLGQGLTPTRIAAVFKLNKVKQARQWISLFKRIGYSAKATGQGLIFC
jgi:hypothetical protein